MTGNDFENMVFGGDDGALSNIDEIINDAEKFADGNTKQPKSLADDLIDFLEQTEQEEIGLTDNQVYIETPDQANYFARKTIELNHDIEEAEFLAKQKIKEYTDRVNKWVDKTTSNLRYQSERYQSMLQVYAAEQLKGTKKKSIKLIEGTLQFRSGGSKYNYDEEIINPLLGKDIFEDFTKVKTEKSLDKAKLKKSGLVKDGKLFLNEQEVPGVTITQQPDTFSVK